MSTIAATNLKNPSSGSNNVVLNADGTSTLGTAKITTLADSAGANTSTPAAIAAGIAKAWVNFNGTGTVAIRASYNVSSITDNGVGDYTVNFTTAMVDANYTSVITCSPNYALTRIVATQLASSAGAAEVAPTSSALRFAVGFQNTTQNGAEFDPKYASVSVFR